MTNTQYSGGRMVYTYSHTFDTQNIHQLPWRIAVRVPKPLLGHSSCTREIWGSVLGGDIQFFNVVR